jgi:RHS repeat-associated protein
MNCIASDEPGRLRLSDAPAAATPLSLFADGLPPPESPTTPDLDRDPPREMRMPLGDGTMVTVRFLYEGDEELGSRAGGAVRHAPDGTPPETYRFEPRQLNAETDLCLHQWRSYDATPGSWLSVDPVGFAGGDLNLYRYCGVRPAAPVGESTSSSGS